MPRLLVFGWKPDGARAVAAELAPTGTRWLATADPRRAAQIASQHPTIGMAVLKCRPSTASLCRALRARRPELALVGLQPDSWVAPHRGCQSVCTLRPAGEPGPLAGMMRALPDPAEAGREREMLRVLIFGAHEQAVATLSQALLEDGVRSWFTSDPLIAIELARLRPGLECVVVECGPSALPLCQQLWEHRPDLEIVGVCNGKSAHPPGECLAGCDQVGSLREVIPLLRERLAS